ncbi:hypothetical protein GOBAR_DD01779 [Gossypium barbadense]|nr:hypothetical protein GOBAR_DD01779 [Gossypium barbadense]
MDMEMEDSRSSSSHSIHSVAFHVYFAAVRTRRFAKNLIPKRRELGFPQTIACSLKEQLARTTLNNVRSQGHTYIELPEERKRFIFFSTLCLAPCYSDSMLLDHLKGNLHTKRLAAANPWPFNDGVLFFGKCNEKRNNWLNDDKVKVPKHEFAVVTFVYNCDLGRKSLLDDVKSLFTSGSPMELVNVVAAGRKRKKSFSDPDDKSESLSNQYDSSREDSSASNSASSRLALDRYDDQLLLTRFISSKAVRRELRRQQCITAERMCDICQQKMLPEKDVTAFHLYHTSCLIHWILLCELETIESHKVNPIDLETKPMGFLISSILCPECQGTGIEVEDDKLEKHDISLSQMFRYKIKVSDGRRAWMKSPEMLESCSTGFHFPSQFGEMVQEKVLPLKLLHFYSTDNCECGSSLVG